MGDGLVGNEAGQKTSKKKVVTIGLMGALGGQKQ